MADALRRCAEVQAIEPVASLQAALKSKSGQPSAEVHCRRGDAY